MPLKLEDVLDSCPISVQKPGLVPACATAMATLAPQFLTIPVGALTVAKVSGAVGGVVEVPGGKVSLPPGGFVDEAGRPFAGEVTVGVTVVDANDPGSLLMMPGDFTGRGLDGQESMIISYGAMYVGLSTSQTGDKLEISPGQTMDLELQSCVSVEAGRGQMPSVWSLDDSTGLWVQSKADLEVEGVRMPTPSEASTEASESDLAGERRVPRKGGKRKGGKKGKKMDIFEYESMSVKDYEQFFATKKTRAYKMTVPTTGWWNADYMVDMSLFRGRVTRDGRPVAGAAVRTFGVSYSGSKRATTNQSGIFSVGGQCMSEVKIEVTERPPEWGIAECVLHAETFGIFTSEEAGKIIEVGDLALT
jgi:hypothetical protein